MNSDDERKDQIRYGREQTKGERTERKRKKRRAVFFDDDTGETYVRRRHRTGSDAWDEYGDDF